MEQNVHGNLHHLGHGKTGSAQHESLLLAGKDCSDTKHHNATMSSVLLYQLLNDYKLSLNVFHSLGNLEHFKRQTNI